MRISIYLLNKDRDLKEYIKNDETYKTYKLNIKPSNTAEGYFVYQEKENKLDWITKINTSKWLERGKLNNTNTIKRGFLLFKLLSDTVSEEKPAIFLISFNNGINLIENMYIDYNFGYGLASKLVSKNKIRKYGSTDIHENIINTDKNSSNSIPQYLIGEKLILSTIESITGYSEDEEFISGNKGLILNYSGEFNVELLQTLEHLYLEYIYANMDDTDDYNKLKKVKNVNEINMLNDELCEEIQNIKSKFLSNRRELKACNLRSMDISVEFNSDIIGYKYTGLNKSKKIYNEIDKIEYFEQLSNYLDEQEITSDDILEKIKRDKIIAIKDLNDSTDDIEYGLYNSLIVRISTLQMKNKKIGMLIGGSWYYVNKDYYDDLNDRLEKRVIRAQLDKFNFIDFNKTTYENELKYNEKLAEVNNGVLLDEKFFNISDYIKGREYSGYSKIEPCDVLLYSHTEKKYYFIHNKINTNTQGISHLSTQANISTSLLLDLEASNDFIHFINNQIKDQRCLNVPELEEISRDNICVILAIIDKDYDKKLKTNFTILKLQALDNCITRLEQLGVEVKIKLIKDSSK